MANSMKLKVMTYNIWNYNEPWPQRRRMIVENILETDPDIVGLQELRDDRNFNSLGHHQAKQIADRTGLDYQFQPAMVYSRTPRKVEGVGILSRYPIESTAYLELTRDPQDEKDVHQRIVFNGTLNLPAGDLHFFVTHFSLSPKMRPRNAVELLRFLSSFNSHLPKLVVGDFNCVPQDTPIRILTGREKLDNQTVMGNLVDTWEEAPVRNRRTIKEDDKTHEEGRIDFIFTSPSPWTRTDVGEVSLIDGQDPSGIKASDHAAVTSTLYLAPDE